MNFKKKTLPNGLRVITISEPQSPTVSVTVMVETGSDYENKRENGLSHFLEHMVFKGTKKRPSHRIISHELDSIGAASNAFTSRECTGYWAKSHPKHFHKILDIVSDIYLNSIFDPVEINRERGVILEEINLYNDSPRDQVGLDFNKLLYGDQPAGRNILGLVENIKRFDKKDFERYRAKHYVASATIVVIAGNFDKKTVVKDVEKAFGDIPTTKKSIKDKVIEKQKSARLNLRNKKSDQVHMALGFKTFLPGKDDDYVLMVLSAILGKGMSSRLFIKVREEMGAAYYIGSGLRFLTDRGYLAIRSGLAKKKFSEVMSEILKECSLLKEELVSAKELKKAKDYVVGRMFLSLETSDAVADFYAEQEILRLKMVTPREYAAKIKAVTSADVRRVARKIFQNKNLNLAIVGDIKDEKPLKKALKI